jgi:hypothetical protein
MFSIHSKEQKPFEKCKKRRKMFFCVIMESLFFCSDGRCM